MSLREWFLWTVGGVLVAFLVPLVVEGAIWLAAHRGSRR